ELAREARLRGCKLSVSEVLIPSVRPAACHLPLGTKGRLFPGKELFMDYTHCTLCPRRCGVDRTAGERGFCGMGDTLRIARAAVHYGEEPAIAGSFGAGA